MFTLSRSGSVVVLMFVIMCGAAFTSPVLAEDAANLRKILADRSPAIVAVKFLLKVSSPGGATPRETEGEAPGILVDAKGLVLCSNTQLGGFVRLLRGGANLTAQATEMKVLIGDDAEGKEATLIAHDTELDLAWVQIKIPPATPLPFVDFRQGATVNLGDSLVAVRKMGKYFDRVGVVSTGQVIALTKKPREYVVPGAGVAAALGLPVFAVDGKVVGVTVLPITDDEEGSRLGTVSRQDLANGIILPAAEVAKATQRAREAAPATAPGITPGTSPATQPTTP